MDYDFHLQRLSYQYSPINISQSNGTHDPTSTLHRPHIDPTSTSHRLYVDLTSTAHRPHIDLTLLLLPTFADNFCRSQDYRNLNCMACHNDHHETNHIPHHHKSHKMRRSYLGLKAGVRMIPYLILHLGNTMYSL